MDTCNRGGCVKTTVSFFAVYIIISHSVMPLGGEGFCGHIEYACVRLLNFLTGSVLESQFLQFLYSRAAEAQGRLVHNHYYSTQYGSKGLLWFCILPNTI